MDIKNLLENLSETCDLNNFINLYKSFDIDLIEDITWNKELSEIEIELKAQYHKFDGYSGFFSIVAFDTIGKFMNQGFHEKY